MNKSEGERNKIDFFFIGKKKVYVGLAILRVFDCHLHDKLHFS